MRLRFRSAAPAHRGGLLDGSCARRARSAVESADLRRLKDELRATARHAAHQHRVSISRIKELDRRGDLHKRCLPCGSTPTFRIIRTVSTWAWALGTAFSPASSGGRSPGTGPT